MLHSRSDGVHIWESPNGRGKAIPNPTTSLVSIANPRPVFGRDGSWKKCRRVVWGEGESLGGGSTESHEAGVGLAARVSG